MHELLGGPSRASITPYASLQPNGGSYEEYRDSLVAWAVRARELGYKAVKAEVTMNGPYAHAGLNESYDRHTEVVAAVRKALGPEVALMVDVQYMWPDAETALRRSATGRRSISTSWRRRSGSTTWTTMRGSMTKPL